LNDSEIEKLAGAMKPIKFLKKEIIIKYGDLGSTYFILSKGSVKVTIY
jgi:CRP-like cAMP-binding protein